MQTYMATLDNQSQNISRDTHMPDTLVTGGLPREPYLRRVQPQVQVISMAVKRTITVWCTWC